MSKNSLLLILFLYVSSSAFPQSSGSITVGGDFNRFYPVTWWDANWSEGKPTEVHIYRTNVHTNSTWRGSLMSTFNFHTSQWGHASTFIRATIACAVVPFIAGWRDATSSNSDGVIIIWLRGGGTTYFYSSAVTVNPVVYDGVQNALPYLETNGPSHTYKTEVDDYVSSQGISNSDETTIANIGLFRDRVGIGTINPDAALTVNGTIHSKEVKVDLNVPAPDYVFEETYQLPSLTEVAHYIQQHKHLPEIPSAKEMEEDGVQLGEMNMMLLKKIEELTLYLIEQNKIIEKLQEERNSASDVSGKKIEELMSFVMELKEENERQGREIETLKGINNKD